MYYHIKIIEMPQFFLKKEPGCKSSYKSTDSSSFGH